MDFSMLLFTHSFFSNVEINSLIKTIFKKIYDIFSIFLSFDTC